MKTPAICSKCLSELGPSSLELFFADYFDDGIRIHQVFGRS